MTSAAQLDNFRPVDPRDLGSLPVYMLSDTADFTRFPWYFIRHVRVDRQTGCWLWTGNVAINPRYPWQQYGQYTINANRSPDGKKHTTTAHRFAFECVFGPIPPGLEPDHTCETKLCIKPWDLELVTRSENMLRHFRRKAARRG
jgi:hypothetical protein